MKPNNFISGMSAGFREHIPELMVGWGICGYWVSLILTMCATSKSERDLAELENGKERPLTKKEVFGYTWKNYIPPVMLATASTASVIGGCAEYKRRNAAIAAVCALAETTLADYRQQAIKLIGEEKEKLISTAVDQKAAERIEEQGAKPIYPKNCDNYLTVQPFYDLYCGRPFYASESSIVKAVNDLNEMLSLDSQKSVTLNDFYSYLGLEPVSFGDSKYWCIDDGTGKIELRPFGSYRSELTGVAYSTMNFSNPPKSWEEIKKKRN